MVNQSFYSKFSFHISSVSRDLQMNVKEGSMKYVTMPNIN